MNDPLNPSEAILSHQSAMAEIRKQIDEAVLMNPITNKLKHLDRALIELSQRADEIEKRIAKIEEWHKDEFNHDRKLPY